MMHDDTLEPDRSLETGLSNETVLTFLETRRSVVMTLMRDPGPTQDQVQRMLRIAVRVPDHGMLTPWRFVLFENEMRDEASRLIGESFESENQEMEPKQRQKLTALLSRVLTHAPLVVLVISCTNANASTPIWEQELSADASV